jgi:hypothetical protein
MSLKWIAVPMGPFRLGLTSVGVVVAALMGAASLAGQAPAQSEQPTFVCPDYSPIAIQACGREHAKTFKPPRTSDGKPDLSGYWGGSQVPHENLEAHPKTPDDTGGPSAIVDVPDGKVPIQPWAEVKRLENKAKYIDQNAQCFMSGVPRHLYMGAYQFVQTPTRLVLLSEETNAYRNVFLDGRPHIGRDIVLWQGDSRGHWEGDTLVVETRHQNGNARLDQQGRFLTDEAVVTERFTMFEPNSILYEATIDDPLVYTRPFTIVSGLKRNLRPGYELWEESCYEGESNSRHLRNIGYRTYPGFSSTEARAAKEAFERRQTR